VGFGGVITSSPFEAFAAHDQVADSLCHGPPVVDSADILRDPAGVLAKLCTALGVAWDPAMPGRAPGSRATAGTRASHWYKAVEASTGFGPAEGPLPALDSAAAAVAEAKSADCLCLHGERLAR
jgi:hypothetical protein